MPRPDHSQYPRSNAARIAGHVARVVLGLAFAVFGLNGFLDFIPHPTTPPAAAAGAFAGALYATGYMLQLVAGTQLVAGLLLLANRCVPLALVLLAPVLVNIVAFHVFLDLGGIAIGAVLCALELALAWRNRDAFRPLFATATRTTTDAIAATAATAKAPARASSTAAAA